MKGKSYTVKSIFYSLQGEGFHAGAPAVFCRFSKCNLWSGREEDRATALCRFCDTDFNGGVESRSAADLAAAINRAWGGNGGTKFVVLTGGEPLLQVDADLIDALHGTGFFIAVETNGTVPAPQGLDWICVSPKAGTTLKQRSGSELKLVFPQPEALPERFEGLAFERFCLQPMDGKNAEKNTRLAVDYCLTHPQWHLSIQTHKMIGIE